MCFVAFQLTFAIITPALITGSTADRLEVSRSVRRLRDHLVRRDPDAPVAHRCLRRVRHAEPLGHRARLSKTSSPEDFAGGTVVHINAGAAVSGHGCSCSGKRKGLAEQPMRGQPTSCSSALLGAGAAVVRLVRLQRRPLNSALTVLQALAWVNTNTATARTALLGWLLAEKICYGKLDGLSVQLSGAVAGLVAITPCCRFGVSPMGSASFIGFIAGFVCAYGDQALKNKNRAWTTSLDVGGRSSYRWMIGTICVRLLLHEGQMNLLGGNNGVCSY